MADLKITGKEVTQVKIDESVLHQVKMRHEYNYGFYHGVFPIEEPLDFIFKLKKVSKITDAMSGEMTGEGFFVNEKVRSVFSKFRLGDHRYYTPVIRLEKNDKILDGYQYFHLGGNYIRDCIDFEKSTFFTTYVTFRKDNIAIKDYEDFQRILGSFDIGWGIDFEKLAIKPNQVIDYDWFLTGLDDINHYVTENLKNAIETAGITGFAFEEVDIVHLQG
jgi:hypothetical protein